MTYTSTEQERESFEALASDNGKLLKAIERDAKGNYLLLTTAVGWMWWQAARRAPAAPVPQGWKLVQIELLERIQESLGSYLSDHGWSQSDMDAADALDGFLAAVPQPPACNQSMQPELATYSAQARKDKGIEQ